MAGIADPIELAVKLKDRRDLLRKLLGDRYESEVGPVRDLLRKTPSQYPGHSLAECALEWAKQAEAGGCNPTPIFAAFVDLCEEGGERG